MRSILVNADRRPGMDHRLETALNLVRTADGHLTILVDTPVARYVSMDPMGGSYVASEALNREMEEDDANAVRIEARLKEEGVSFDCIRSEAEPVEALAKAARLADLVIVSRSSGLGGELALAVRTPVLVLPDDKALSVPLQVACLAWDGGDEAAHALRSATPLLAGCTSVKMLCVAEKSGGFSPAEAVGYLSHHGIAAELNELQRRGSTEETLAAAVTDARPDLLVMGAFGHSRMREYLFGGVTRHFLEDAEAPPLFLVH